MLVYVGFLLIPYDKVRQRSDGLTRLDVVVAVAAAAVSFATYGIDKAMLLVFVVYTALIIKNDEARRHIVLLVVTALLLAAILAQSL